MMTVKLNGTDILQQMFQISSLQGITFQYIKVLKNFKDYLLVNEYNIVIVEIGKSLFDKKRWF